MNRLSPKAEKKKLKIFANKIYSLSLRPHSEKNTPP